MNAIWRVFADVNSEKKAETVLKNFLKELDATQNDSSIESYHKGGFLIKIEVITKDGNWAQVVLHLLTLAERVGRGWQISGSIQNELDLWTNESNIVGIQAIQLQCARKIVA